MRSALSIACLIVLFVAMPAGSEEDSLRVLSATPRGEIASLSEGRMVVVTFDRPMAPLQAVPVDTGVGPLRIEPPVSGVYRWMGTSTLTFAPDEPLPYATRFVAMVPVGARSLSGDVLAENFVWKFETPRPALLQSFPKNGAKHVELDSFVFLRFNQPVHPASAGSHIRFRDLHTNAAVPCRVRHAREEELQGETGSYRPLWRYRGRRGRLGDDAEAVLVLEPEGDLSAGTRYEVEIQAGFRGVQGPLPAVASKAIHFETFGVFSFVGIQQTRRRSPAALPTGEEQRRDPIQPLGLVFSNPVRLADLVRCIRFEPEVHIPEHYSTYDFPLENVWLSLSFLPDTTYTVAIADSLQDMFGNRLSEPASLTFRTGDYSPAVRISSAPGIVEATGPHRYPIDLVNVDSVRLQVAGIEADRIVPLFAKTGDGGRQSDLFSTRYEVRDVDFAVDRMWRPGLPRNRRVRLPIEIDDALGDRPTGVVLVQIDNLKKGSRNRRVYKAVLQVTHMGVTAKSSPVNNLVWVTNLRDGEPISGAEVEVRDDDNRVLWSGRTDAEGRAETPGWGPLGVVSRSRWGQPRQWFIVRKGGDVAFAASDWGSGIAPYRFGIRTEWNPRPQKLRASLFTERGIYRAGDEVYLKGILRQKSGAGEWEAPAGFGVLFRVVDSQGQNVLTDTLRADDWGAFADTVRLSGTAHLGTYYAYAETLAVVRDRRMRRPFASASFRVEAYRPAEFEVTVRTPVEAYVFGDSARATVDGRYLFGAAMAGQPVAWRLRLHPAGFQPPGFPGFHFGPLEGWGPSGRRAQSRLLDSREGKLSGEGGIAVGALLSADDYSTSAELLIEATVTGPSRRSISGRKTVRVHRGAFYLGLRPKTTFAEVDSPLTFQAAAATPDGEPVAGRTARVTVLRRQWHSVRKAGVGGRYEWVVEVEDTAVDSMAFTSAGEPIQLRTTPDAAGLYFIRAESRDARGNPVVGECHFYATGRGYVAWERSDDDRIELVPDADRYRPGDTARILVKSPFESAVALVALEREGVLSTSVERLTGTAPAIEVPINEGHLPNVFVSVVLQQGRTAENRFSEKGEDIGRPQFKIGYVNLPVDAGSRRLQVGVAADRSTYRPGDVVTVDVDVRRADGGGARAEVALAAVDAGVLNLIGYRLPDPFDAFYGQRPLSVQTAETRLHLVAQRNYGEKGESRGGGGGVRASASGIAMRGDFRATAHWTPGVFTDADGKARVTFKLPDNLTTWQVMAVAHTREAEFGRGEATFAVRKPLLMQAALPRFARIGDAFEAGVVVHNHTGKRGKVSLTLQAGGIRLSDRKRTTFRMDPGESREVRFRFRAEEMGRATFGFRARMRKETDGLEVSLPVQAPRRREAAATTGDTDGEVRESLIVPTDIFPDLGGIEVTAASTALVGLAGGIDYLFRYPYGCLEQRLSRILPAILAGDLVDAFGLSGPGGGDFREVVASTLKELAAFQMQDGSFRYWRDGHTSHPYVSAYAVYAMAQAKANGYSPDERVLSRGQEFLREFLHGRHDGRWGFWSEASRLSAKALSLYALALAGKPEAAYAERLFEQRDKMPLFARAFLLKALASAGGDEALRGELARGFSNTIRTAPTQAHFEETDAEGLWWCWHSNVRTTAIVLQALLEAEGGHPMAAKAVRWLLDQRREGRWGNTQENLYAMDALATYFRRYEGGDPDFTAEIRLAGRTLLESTFRGRSLRTERREVDLDAFPDGEALPLEVRREGTGRLYYLARMSYYPRGFEQPREEGMAVLKEMATLDTAGAADGVFRAGDLVRVTVRLITPQQRSYVVVEDPLPAGFEAVNLSLATESRELGRRLGEIRRERGRRPWAGFRHTEMHDDRVLLFADRLNAGVHAFTYLARATTAGTFVMPPAHAEEMYAPEVFGRSRSATVRVE